MRLRSLACALALPTVTAVVLASPASAVQVSQSSTVSSTPSASTPNILDGHVEEITQVGSRIIVGGNFTKVQDAKSTTTVARKAIFAFDATTGKIDTGFAPALNNQVNALLPGPTPDTVYVGGTFTTVGGTTAQKLVLLSTVTGARVAGFTVPALNGAVGDVKRVGGRLYVGGAFTTAGGKPHAGLVTLSATTGALDPYLNLQVATNHNYGQPGYSTSDARAAVGVTKLDINPAGTRLVAIGNFKTVNGAPHDQVFMADLTSPTSATLADWQTNGYTDPCYRWAYDSWIRDVDFSPDGSYFVIVGTGGYPGYNGTRLCDAAARWDTAATGSDLRPTWVDWTGGDTLLSVAITGTSVYVGGHQRWLNNPYNSDRAGEGAVARPGLAALNPLNGLPQSWNPGRNPRGAGAYALYASSTGLYVGSDTDYIGNRKYKRQRIAYFPLAGGSTALAGDSNALPGTVYSAGTLPGQNRYNVLYRENEGGPTLQPTDAGPVWDGDSGTDDAAIRNSGSNAAVWSAGSGRAATLPASAPSALFDSERWDPNDGNEMTYHFAVPTDAPLRVRLFFANRCTCTSSVGARTFDVTIDGNRVLSSYDIVADVGDQVGTMKEFTLPAETDGSVDITFGHEAENPLVNGIEISRTDQADPPAVAPGGDTLTGRSFDGASSGTATAVDPGGLAWSHVRGAFVVGGRLFYGYDDGTLHSRTFSQGTLGADTVVNPYHDPAWMSVDSGSGTTYDGATVAFYAELPTVTGMFSASGRIYYTLQGQSGLYSRYFDPDSGVVGGQELGPVGSGFDSTAGVVLDSTHDVLYTVSASTGNLLSQPWSVGDGTPGAGQPTGTPTVVAGGDWRGRAVFVG